MNNATKIILGFLINILILFITLTVIIQFIPEIDFEILFIQTDVNSNLIFLMYYIIYGIISMKYMKNETVGDFLLKIERNKEYKEYKDNKFINSINLSFVNILRIIKDLFLISMLKFLYIKFKNRKRSKKNGLDKRSKIK